MTRSTTHRRFLIVAVGVACTLGLSGCAGFDRSAAVDSFMTTHPSADMGEAECVVDALIEEYTLEGLEVELETVPQRDAFELTQFRAMFSCGMTEAVNDLLVVELQARDHDAETAGCIADTLIGTLDDEDLDVLLTGEMTDAFYSKYFDATEACGALP